MSQDEILSIVLDRLEENNVPYMIVGSFASNLYVQRGTLDVEYLHTWARHLTVEDLLDKVLGTVAN
jgi:hypothetical protein